jgi:hypothetical protein
MSWIRSVASLTEMAVLSSDSKPLLAESFGELMWFRDVIRRLRCDSAGEYPGQTWWWVNREAHWLMLSPERDETGKCKAYAAPGIEWDWEVERLMQLWGIPE